ncbi:MAG: YbaB/EbfC family nucleoid-associated protein [Acutalibacteraceae bacterium]|jgi:DNA-binding YbaB/EbfC family protein|nr:YbaB/EbfC family nucleoid-associated protein [Acutalibacteraceae bacterium]
MKARIPNQGGNSQAAMMKKIQDMQNEMARIQEEVENSEFSASAGGGAVEVTVNGKHEVLDVKIQPDVVDPEDVEILSDMIIAATNEAIRKAADTMEQRMGSATSGMGLPAGLGF